MPHLPTAANILSPFFLPSFFPSFFPLSSSFFSFLPLDHTPILKQHTRHTNTGSSRGHVPTLAMRTSGAPRGSSSLTQGISFKSSLGSSSLNSSISSGTYRSGRVREKPKNFGKQPRAASSSSITSTTSSTTGKGALVTKKQPKKKKLKKKSSKARDDSAAAAAAAAPAAAM